MNAIYMSYIFPIEGYHDNLDDLGWIFSTGFYDEENKNREILVRLPDTLRKMGKKGMSISCMALGKLKNGVWAPFNPYDNEYACANVYPD
jgi:hypothetical protein